MVREVEPQRETWLHEWVRVALACLGGSLMGLGISLIFNPPSHVEFPPACAAADCATLIERAPSAVITALLIVGPLLLLIAANGRRFARR